MDNNKVLENRIKEAETEIWKLRTDHETCKTGTTKDIQRVEEKVERVFVQNEKILTIQNEHTSLLTTITQSRGSWKEWFKIIGSIAGGLLTAALIWLASQAIK